MPRFSWMVGYVIVGHVRHATYTQNNFDKIAAVPRISQRGTVEIS